MFRKEILNIQIMQASTLIHLLQACENLENAVAITYSDRYILYGKDF